MRKHVILLLCFVAYSSLTRAKTLDLGPRLGISYNSLKIRKNREAFITDNKFGYQIGGFARIKLLSFYAQPELLVTGSSVGVKRSIDAKDITLSFTKLDAPIMFGYSFFSLRAQLGPTFSLLLNAAHKGEKQLEKCYQKISLGYQLGVGIDIWKLMLDLKYEGNLSRFGQKIVGVDTDHRLRQFIFSIGFKV